MKDELYKKIGEIDDALVLPDSAYEKIFNMYRDENVHYAFNLSRTVNIPANIDDDFVFYTRVAGRKTWTQLSFDIYGTIRLWWLICLVNKIMNPVLLPDPGTVIKVIKPETVPSILESIHNQM